MPSALSPCVSGAWEAGSRTEKMGRWENSINQEEKPCFFAYCRGGPVLESSTLVKSPAAAVVLKVRSMQESSGRHWIKFLLVFTKLAGYQISVFKCQFYIKGIAFPREAKQHKASKQTIIHHLHPLLRMLIAVLTQMIILHLIMKMPVSKPTWLLSVSNGAKMIWPSFDLKHNGTLKSSRLSILASEISSLITVLLSEHPHFHAALANKGPAISPCLFTSFTTYFSTKLCSFHNGC